MDGKKPWDPCRRLSGRAQTQDRTLRRGDPWRRPREGHRATAGDAGTEPSPAAARSTVGRRGRESCHTPQSKIKATNKVSSRKLASAETTGAAATPAAALLPPLSPKRSLTGRRSSETAVSAGNLPESQPSLGARPCCHHLARGQKTPAISPPRISSRVPSRAPLLLAIVSPRGFFLNAAVRISAVCPGRPFLCFGELFGWRTRIS